jgi:RNA polymerase subunit RPABC4/transcription elongation factor Spt4
MRIKTFEKAFSLRDLYESIKPKVRAEFVELDDNSECEEKKFMIIGVNPEDKSIVVRGSLDRRKRRTYVSVQAVNTKDVSGGESVGKSIVKIVGKGGAAGIASFTGLAIKGLKYAANKVALGKYEKYFMDIILGVVSEVFGYSEKLFPYKFKISKIDGALELWEKIYGDYITAVENRLLDTSDLISEVYRNYDFASQKEDEQRIIDLVVMHEEETERPRKGKPAASKGKPKGLGGLGKSLGKGIARKLGDARAKAKGVQTHNLTITFVYANKTLAPMKMRQLMTLSEQVGTFKSKLLDKMRKYVKVNPTLITLSLYGYEKDVAKYLRKNIYRDIRGVIPIFSVPPMRDDVWNNFKATEFTKRDKRSKVFQKIKKVTGGSGDKLDLLKLKEGLAALDAVYMSKWSDVLQIHMIDSILDIDYKKKKIKKYIAEYEGEGEVRETYQPAPTQQIQYQEPVQYAQPAQPVQQAPQKECSKCGQGIQEGWKLCPACGNPLEEKKCLKCGQTVQEGWKLCPACGNSLEEKNCPKCGKSNPKESKFCIHCGALIFLQNI